MLRNNVRGTTYITNIEPTNVDSLSDVTPSSGTFQINGNLNATGTLTIQGSTTLNNVNVTNNASVGGNANVTGSVDAVRYISDATTGDAITTDGNKFKVDAGSGSITTEGVLVIGANSGNGIKVNVNKFVVDAANGNVSSTGWVNADEIVLNKSSGNALKLSNNNFIVTADGNVTSKGALDVEGSSVLKPSGANVVPVTIRGLANQSANLLTVEKTASASPNAVSNAFTVDENGDLTNARDVSIGRNLIGAGNASVAGNATVTGDMTVSGSANLNLVSTQGLATLDSSSISKTLVVSGTGVASLSNVVSVTGQLAATRLATGSDTILGSGANRSGSNGFAVSIGRNANENNAGNQSICIGNECSNASRGPSGQDAIAIGGQAKCLGTAAIAIGQGSQANSANSVAIGHDASSTQDNRIQLGASGTFVAGFAGQFSPPSTNTVGFNTGYNQFAFIGSTAPSITSLGIMLASGGGRNNRVVWYYNWAMYGTSGGSLKFFFGNNPWSNTAVTASLTAAGIFTNSDIRLKRDIKTLEYGLNELRLLKPVTYRFKPVIIINPETGNVEGEDKNAKFVNIGLIAQEVEKVIPEVVLNEKQDGMKSVNYTQLIPVLINAINEQQIMIDNLISRVNFLESVNRMSR